MIGTLLVSARAADFSRTRNQIPSKYPNGCYGPRAARTR